MTGGMMGGGFVPPTDDAGRCFQACLEQFACDPSPAESCGHQAQAALASACQRGCAEGSTSAIEAAAAMGCGGGDALVTAAGLSCVDESACAEVTCNDGEGCEAGACAPWACFPDFYDDEGNDTREFAALLPFEAHSEPALTLCAGDEDWFTINVPAGSSLRVDLGFKDAEADIDAKLYVGNEENTTLTAVSSDDNERLTLTPSDEARLVTLQVFVYGNAGATEDNPATPARYSLHISTDLPAPICHRGGCGGDDVCNSAGVCVPPPPCMTDDDCGFSETCNVATGLCMECQSNDDCGAGVCDLSNNTCVTCLGNADCSEGEVCDVEADRCVECLVDGDCGDGTCNDNNRCIPNNCSDMYEPNDEQMSAVPFSGEASGLYLCGDEDWYVLELNGSPALLTVSFIHADGDIELALVDAEGNFIARRTSSTDNEQLALIGRTGTHYLRVYGAGFVVNTYTLTLNTNPPADICFSDEDCPASRCQTQEATCYPEGYCGSNFDCEQVNPNAYCSTEAMQCESCMLDAAEPNDSVEAPSSLSAALGQPLNSCGANDFYAFEAQAGERISININFIHADGDVDAKLYAPNPDTGMLSPVTFASGVMDNELIEHDAMISGTYVLEVYGFGNGPGNTYTISR
jgi:hypothetical protein